MSINHLDSLNNIYDEHTVATNTEVSPESISPISDIEISRICETLYLRTQEHVAETS